MRSVNGAVKLEDHTTAEIDISAPPSQALISVVISAKDEKQHIGDVIQEIKDSLNGYPYEIIVVNDGSVDDTEERAIIHGVKVVSHPVCLGKGAAMKTGVKHSFGDIIVFIDADGVHDPRSIPDMVELILSGEADMVIGSRATTRCGAAESSVLRNWANDLAALIISILISFLLPHKKRPEGVARWIRISDCTSGYRSIKRDSWDKLCLVSCGFQIETEMIYEAAKNHLVLGEVPIKCRQNNTKISHLSIMRDRLLTLKLLIKKFSR